MVPACQPSQYQSEACWDTDLITSTQQKSTLEGGQAGASLWCFILILLLIHTFLLPPSNLQFLSILLFEQPTRTWNQSAEAEES
jgi:hypothetical protein